jgi:voltage-gated potassium channel
MGEAMLTELLVASGIVVACVLIHTAGVVVIAEWLIKRRSRIELRLSTTLFTLLLIVLFAVIVVLHFTEAAIWALFYHWCGLFPDYETSLYFSLKSYTTIGYGDVLLPESWRILGCLEGISGVLLCGLSTAFIFVVFNALIQIRMRRQADV